MNTIVNIEEKAFMGIMLAAVEAYPSKYCGSRRPKGSTPEGEVHGLLFGQQMQKNEQTRVFNVTLAVGNQMVLERSDSGVSVSYSHIERIREITELYPTYTLLGFFHSHPYPKGKFHKLDSVEPSGTDMEDAIWSAESEGREMLDLILGITRQQRRSWSAPQFPRQHMIHACCGNYRYTLSCCSAWQGIDDRYYYQPVYNLICPVASGIQQVDLL